MLLGDPVELALRNFSNVVVLLPVAPERDDIDASDAFAGAAAELVRLTVRNLRARRNYAHHYCQALACYASSLTLTEFFSDATPTERAGWVQSRRATRKHLDLLGCRLPPAVHQALVAAVALGGSA